MTEAQDVTFVNGDAAAVTFRIERLPNTVERLDGMDLDWHNEGPAHQTKHTLFIVDRMPRGADNAPTDEYLWEIAEWSCGWAAGTKGRSAVFAGLWAQFHPSPALMQRASSTWKNHLTGVNPNEDLTSAVQSQDPPTPANEQNAVRCIMFDLVLINCLGLRHVSAEVELEYPPGKFIRGGTLRVRWVAGYDDCRSGERKLATGLGKPLDCVRQARKLEVLRRVLR